MSGPNITQLLSPSLGNTAQDLSGGIAGFAAGLAKEKERQRQVALDQALLQLKNMEVTRKGLGTPKHVVVQTPDGLRHALQWNNNQIDVSNSPAPESQIPVPLEDATTHALGVGVVGRNTPGQAVRQLQLPPGQAARETSVPVIEGTEGPNGPQYSQINRRTLATATVGGGVDGQPLQPTASEAYVRRARDAYQMIQGQVEMKDALRRNPNALGEVAQHMAAMGVWHDIPLAGHAVEDFIRQAQSGMSPEAAQYYGAMMQAAAAVAFSRGGTALTQNEIDYSLSSLSPKVGESASTSAMRDRLWRGQIGTAIQGNPAWNRYRALAEQLGFTDQPLNDLAPPSTQPSTGVNPRFDPRGQR